MCTQGAFQRARQLRSLMSISMLQVHSLPILADESFQFPTSSFLEGTDVVVNLPVDTRLQLMRFILDVFKTIAVAFHPQHYSDTVLDAKAAQIFLRIEEKSTSAC